MSYLLIEGLPLSAPLAEQEAFLAELLARPDVDELGVQAAIRGAHGGVKFQRILNAATDEEADAIAAEPDDNEYI